MTPAATLATVFGTPRAGWPPTPGSRPCPATPAALAGRHVDPDHERLRLGGPRHGSVGRCLACGQPRGAVLADPVAPACGADPGDRPPTFGGTAPLAQLPTTSRQQLGADVAEHGAEWVRARVCGTCWTAAARWPDWTADPVLVVARETHGPKTREGMAAVAAPAWRTELRALAALVAAHPAEYTALVEGLTAAPALHDARVRRRDTARARAAHRARRSPPEPPAGA